MILIVIVTVKSSGCLQDHRQYLHHFYLIELKHIQQMTLMKLQNQKEQQNESSRTTDKKSVCKNLSFSCILINNMNVSLNQKYNNLKLIVV